MFEAAEAEGGSVGERGSVGECVFGLESTEQLEGTKQLGTLALGSHCLMLAI